MDDMPRGSQPANHRMRFGMHGRTALEIIMTLLLSIRAISLFYSSEVRFQMM